ncbi:hypothetical protein K523DRAFT_311696 [Schizophyllum commune Tattone D]|nr:hypothetical protein K523DRAFT_311696 [Schizophyllum commune Tattone D]
MGIPTTTSRSSKATATKAPAATSRNVSASDKVKHAAVAAPKPPTKRSADPTKGTNADPDKFTCKRCGALLLDCKNMKITELLRAPRRAIWEQKRKCKGAPHSKSNPAHSSSTAASSKVARTSDKAKAPTGRKSATIDVKRPTAAGNSRSSSFEPSISSVLPSRPMKPKPKAASAKAPSKIDSFLRKANEEQRARKEAETRANAEFVIDRGTKRRLEAERAAEEKKEKATTHAAMDLIYGGKLKNADDEAAPAAKRQKMA